MAELVAGRAQFQITYDKLSEVDCNAIFESGGAEGLAGLPRSQQFSSFSQFPSFAHLSAFSISRHSHFAHLFSVVTLITQTSILTVVHFVRMANRILGEVQQSSFSHCRNDSLL